jgi:hypothetical protein
MKVSCLSSATELSQSLSLSYLVLFVLLLVDWLHFRVKDSKCGPSWSQHWIRSAGLWSWVTQSLIKAENERLHSDPRGVGGSLRAIWSVCSSKACAVSLECNLAGWPLIKRREQMWGEWGRSGLWWRTTGLKNSSHVELLRCNSRTRIWAFFEGGTFYSFPHKIFSLLTTLLNLKELMVHVPNCQRCRLAVRH